MKFHLVELMKTDRDKIIVDLMGRDIIDQEIEYLTKQANRTHKDIEFLYDQMEFSLSLVGFLKEKVQGEIGDVERLLKHRKLLEYKKKEWVKK